MAPLSLATLILLLAASLVASPPSVSAQAESATNTEFTSAAVPFIGSYEVWCTDRNPAPFNLCSSHHGSPAIDFGMPIGAEVRATGTGEVIIADAFCSGSGWCNSGAGNYVVIEHPDGSYSRYLHLDSVSVQVDQHVVAGTLIGTNGNTGHSSSPHLHYDEQQPLGTRVNFGTFIGCVGGEKVRYPEVFGTSDWNQVPYGSIVVNEGYGCHGQDDPDDPTEPEPVDPEPGGDLGAAIGPALFDGRTDDRSFANPVLAQMRLSLQQRFSRLSFS